MKTLGYRIDIRYPTELKGPINSLIKNLANRRLQMGLTQLQLDARIGIADGLTAKWESGARLPSSFLLSCWATALECELSIKPYT